jgi:Tfp pilus assembly protein PilF
MMFHTPWRAPLPNLRLFCLVAALMLTLPLVVVHGQGGVGSTRGLPDSASGIHTIQGRVLLPTGRRAEQGVLVRLSSNVAGSRSASTDTDGVFIFNGLPAGEYRITVDGGPQYAPVSKSVVIYGTTGGTAGMGRTGQTMMMDVTLVPKDGAASDAQMFPGVPKEAVDAYRKGMQFAQAGDSKKAAESLKNAVTLHPKFESALTELGTQYLKLNDAAKAAEVLKQATDLAPKNFTARLRYGIALLNDKKPANAEAELREALKINAASPAAHMYLGITLLSLSRDEKTKAFNAEKSAEAQKELESAASSGKDEVAMAHRYLGGIYWGQKDHKRAADELETYLKLEPKASDAERIRAAIKDLRSKQ